MSINKNFVVKNGFEVSTDLIFADADTQRVGIGTQILNHTLEVNGDIKSDALNVSGLGSITNIVSTSATFTNIDIENILTPTLTFQTIEADVLDLSNGTIRISGNTGSIGDYLVSTGTGVDWAQISSSRESESIIAIPGQTILNDLNYNVDSLDVFINGVKLSASDYSATDGLSITLGSPCFGGELIELISYNINNFSSGNANLTGTVTATGGFISVANTSPVQIKVVGNQLTFNVVGIGSTTLTLF